MDSGSNKQDLPTSHNRTPVPRTVPGQSRLADVLFSGSWYALFLLTVTFLVYAFGFKAPYIPLDRVPTYWSMPVDQYVREAAIPQGWGWISLAARGDFLTLSAIALILSLAPISLALIVPSSLKQKDMVLTLMLVAQLLILCFAASALLRAGAI